MIKFIFIYKYTHTLSFGIVAVCFTDYALCLVLIHNELLKLLILLDILAGLLSGGINPSGLYLHRTAQHNTQYLYEFIFISGKQCHLCVHYV